MVAADRKDIPYDQHPDHRFRIDRRAARGGIVGCKFAAEPGQIESGIDLSRQVIFGNAMAEMKLVEQLRPWSLFRRPIMDRRRRDSRQHNGITLRGVSQPAFATKSAKSGRFRKNSDLTRTANRRQ